MVALAPTARPLSPAQQAWVRALDRAKSVATAKPVYTPAIGTYRVVGSTGTAYTVIPMQAGRRVDYSCTCTAGTRGLVCWHKALVAACPIETARRNKAKAAPRCGSCSGPQVAGNGDICNGCTMATIEAHIAPSTAAEIALKAAMVAEITRELVAFDAAYALPASLAAARAGLR